MNASQLRYFVVQPALESIGPYSEEAEALLMGTAAQESRLKYVRQLGNGPALGLFQMEPATHDDIWKNYLSYKPELINIVLNSIEADRQPKADRMIWDLRYAAIMCRLHYRRVPERLPDKHDIWAQAAYWKKYYNTPLGHGTEEEFVRNYRLIQ